MGYRIINGVQYPAYNIPIDTNKSPKPSKALGSIGDLSFNDMLREKINKKEGFTISNHAAQRMEGFSMNPSDMKKINDAINMAKDKGAKNCLIVYRDVAMVTSIENRTVITAVDKSRSKDNVFTNVDSVILL